MLGNLYKPDKKSVRRTGLLLMLSPVFIALFSLALYYEVLGPIIITVFLFGCVVILPVILYKENHAGEKYEFRGKKI